MDDDYGASRRIEIDGEIEKLEKGPSPERKTSSAAKGSGDEEEEGGCWKVRKQTIEREGRRRAETENKAKKYH